MSIDLNKVRDLFIELAGPHEAIIGDVANNMVVVEKNGKLLDYASQNRSVRFNRLNPVYRLLEEHPRPIPAEVYLLSSMLSVINRVETSYLDEHEREFHSRLVERLLQSDP